MPLVLAGLITLLLLPILVFAFVILSNYVIDFAMNSMGMRSLVKRPSTWIDGGLVLATVAALLVAERVFRRLRWRIFPYDGSVCGKCGYDLRGSSTGVCPECGRAAGDGA